MSPKLLITDGGRAASGFKGEARDCVCRAIAIVLQMDYAEVYKQINAICKGSGFAGVTARTGLPKAATRKVMESFGFKWVALVEPGSSVRVHMREGELPEGRVICRLTKHVVAVIDGVVHDTHDPCRAGNRTVYGYWHHAG